LRESYFMWITHYPKYSRLLPAALPQMEVSRTADYATGAVAYAQAARFMQPALVNGAVGLILQ